MDGHWSQAEEPLHWLVDSPDPVHSGDPATRESASAEAPQEPQQRGGARPAVRVGAGRTRRESPSAWSPPRTAARAWRSGTRRKKDEGGKSLYGSMLRQVKLAGGKVKGVLWYQGESDANPEAAEGLPQGLRRLHRGRPVRPRPARAAVLLRADRPGHPRRATRRRGTPCRRPSGGCPSGSPNTAVVAAIDLELDDGIHVGTQGLKRLGRRLARIAERELFGQVGATTPRRSTA